MKRALLVHNPYARRAPNVDRLRDAAARIGDWEVELRTTDRAGHGTEIARHAADLGYEAVVACGGDGTVNEAVNGLAGSRTALAVIRGGTANVWGKEIGVPKDAAKALRLLVEGETRVIDLGRAGDRYFVCMAGAGFDAAIVREMAAGALKKRIGAAAYVLTGLRLARSWPATSTELRFDGQSTVSDVFWLMIGNTRNYGGVLNIAYMAQADNGALEALVLRRGGLWQLTVLLPQVLLKRLHRGKAVTHRRVQSLEIATQGLPVQADGEYIGETPLRFDVAPGALRVIVPRGLQSPLFVSSRL